MDKLLESYNKECSFKSFESDSLWKKGRIVISVFIMIYFALTKNSYVAIGLFTISVLILIYICEFLEIKKIMSESGYEGKVSKIIFFRRK